MFLDGPETGFSVGQSMVWLKITKVATMSAAIGIGRP